MRAREPRPRDLGPPLVESVDRLKRLLAFKERQLPVIGKLDPLMVRDAGRLALAAEDADIRVMDHGALGCGRAIRRVLVADRIHRADLFAEPAEDAAREVQVEGRRAAAPLRRLLTHDLDAVRRADGGAKHAGHALDVLGLRVGEQGLHPAEARIGLQPSAQEGSRPV